MPIPKQPQIQKQSSPEQFHLSTDKSSIFRNVQRSDGTYTQTCFELSAELRCRTLTQERLSQIADLSFLRSTKWPPSFFKENQVRVADIFSGCGLMTLGVWEASRALGFEMIPVYALDANPIATKVYKLNFPHSDVQTCKIEQILNNSFGENLSPSELLLKKKLGKIELLVGGPPCQGHSDLNNHTRRNDPKNKLYEKVARFAEIIKPNHIIIENVPTVTNDLGKSMEMTASHLKELNYSVKHAIVETSELGMAQKRRRHILVASFKKTVEIQETIQLYKRQSRKLSWAIGDLLNMKMPTFLDVQSRISPDNLKRIEYLFEHDIHDLPNSQRPRCHRLKNHSYKSVYGRMHWDKPAQTITSGFTSTGQGRFVHPKKKRTITPHEAARLQFIPDFFNWGDNIPRAILSDLIGNAVPPKLTYVFALELLR